MKEVRNEKRRGEERKKRRRRRRRREEDVSGKSSNEKKVAETGRTVGEKRSAREGSDKAQHAYWNWMKQRKEQVVWPLELDLLSGNRAWVAPTECSAYVRGFDWENCPSDYRKIETRNIFKKPYHHANLLFFLC